MVFQCNISDRPDVGVCYLLILLIKKIEQFDHVIKNTFHLAWSYIPLALLSKIPKYNFLSVLQFDFNSEGKMEELTVLINAHNLCLK